MENKKSVDKSNKHYANITSKIIYFSI